MNGEKKARQVFLAQHEQRRRRGKATNESNINWKQQETEEQNLKYSKMTPSRDQYRKWINGPTLKGNRGK